MTAPLTPQRNPMVIAVLKEMHRYDVDETKSAQTARRFVRAVLDSLPWDTAVDAYNGEILDGNGSEAGRRAAIRAAVKENE